MDDLTPAAEPSAVTPAVPAARPDAGPELAGLVAIEQALARLEQDLRGLRTEVGAELGFEGTDTVVVSPDPAPVPPAAEGPADRLVGVVARLSLAAQERAEAVIARRSAQRTRPRAPASAVRSRLAGSRRLQVAAAATVAGLLAVLLLDIGGTGRSSEGRSDQPDAAPLDAAPPDAAPTTAGVEPDVSTPPAASGTDVAGPVDVVAPSQRIAPPVSLRAPAIEVDAPVVVVGLEPDRSMEIPADVRTVGWYEPFPGAGVVPGEPGTAVIAGHVDSRTQGRGAFWPLRDLAPGDVVDVEHADGTVSRWRIESVVRHPKTDIPIEDIFTFEGDERLALITCGGEFDRSVGAYLDNYVVTAVPLRTTVGGSVQTLPGVG